MKMLTNEIKLFGQNSRI